jgi:hypothetical protein
MRRLLCTRRRVALDRVDEYLFAWLAAGAAAGRAGARAWLFRGSDHEDQFMEFVEWDDAASDPLADDDVAAALAQLAAFGAVIASDEWEEAT